MAGLPNTAPLIFQIINIIGSPSQAAERTTAAAEIITVTEEPKKALILESKEDVVLESESKTRDARMDMEEVPTWEEQAGVVRTRAKICTSAGNVDLVDVDVLLDQRAPENWISCHLLKQSTIPRIPTEITKKYRVPKGQQVESSCIVDMHWKIGLSNKFYKSKFYVVSGPGAPRSVIFGNVDIKTIWNSYPAEGMQTEAKAGSTGDLNRFRGG